MEITVNHQNYHLEELSSVEHMLILILGSDAKGMAVAINQNIIPRSNWSDHLLQNGDQITLITATQGG